jgi:hypothetical protein
MSNDATAGGVQSLTISGNTTSGDLAIPSGTDWNITTLKPNVNSEANSIRSIQLKIAANGTVPKNFQINDMTIVYRERTLR